MDRLIGQEKTKHLRDLLNTDPAAAAATIKQYLEQPNNIPLNIAVTGECGSGKSSFVNAFRGVTNKDKGAAPTGCVETTTEVTAYQHPKYPNVKLWDLPGVGTTRFTVDKYLKHVGFEKFDFFIIISDTRFKKNDVKLALEIQKMDKKFYFVRSKIDNDLRSEERSQRNFNAENYLKQIRDSCTQGLQKEGFESPQVFLISSFELHLHDFSLLRRTLERELPEHQRHVLLLAMSNISLDVIEKKKEAFRASIKYYALASAAGAAVPVPGLSVAVDLPMMVYVVRQYVVGFGLDKSSLKRLADSTGVSFDDLKAAITSELVTKEITKDLLVKLLAQLANVAALLAAEEGARFIPILGIPAAMTLSGMATRDSLNFFLDILAKEAQRVFVRALSVMSQNVM
ncbi:interferon-inducible GTPase 5-like [Melanotaenia boesemani]|uniref:interferon-inducible GTPase 5-like n=1 Tax=Melanotaenia boesemani TaxID=1250792 RepID=UPI001C040E8D|nr:interferon-inducible GTPase 5-like [Melanotaenia boesemani]